MKKGIPMMLSLVSIVVAALCIFQLFTCSAEVVDEVEGGVVVVEATIEKAIQEEPEIVEPEITWQEIGKEIQSSLSDSWPVLNEGQMYDVSNTILDFAKERSVDPIIMADEFSELANVVLDMRPDFVKGRDGGHMRAMMIALDIYRGSTEMKDVQCSQIIDGFSADEGQVPRINPYILVSMGYRESRFMTRTELGYTMVNGQKVTDCLYCRGSRGEEGMFQFMPGGWIQAMMPDGCSPFDRLCSARGAAKALAKIRCICIEQFGQRCTVDTYVAGYGSNKIPSPEYAKSYRSVEVARDVLCKVRQDCSDFWPRSSDEEFALTL